MFISFHKKGKQPVKSRTALLIFGLKFMIAKKADSVFVLSAFFIFS